MGHFKLNARGGLSVDRDSLHASPEFKRQIEALSKLSGNCMTLTQNVADAVDYIDASGFKGAPIYESSWQTIRAHLMSQEAEIDRRIADHSHMFVRAREWAELSGENERRANLAESRLAAADALLRTIAAYTPPDHECRRGCPKETCEACKLANYLQGAGDEA